MRINNFADIVKEVFVFLETKFKFQRQEITKDSVRYETNDIFVTIAYDSQRSYELSLGLGRKNHPVEEFNFGEILRSANAPQSIPSSYQVSSENMIKHFLGELGKALEIYGSSFLQNDAKAFEELLNLRRRECEQYNLESNLRVARTKAEKAWHQKDYAAVIKAFNPFRAALTASEIGKLEFAEKELNK